MEKEISFIDLFINIVKISIMAYKSRYRVKNPDKYRGDPTNVIARSNWELQALKWCDTNPHVKSFSSEEVVVPYISDTDKKQHLYYVDLLIEFTNGETLLVEIKPAAQTRVPERPKTGRKTRRFINESLTYVKNMSKWKAADAYAKARGWKFVVWTEVELKALGLKLIGR